VTLKRYKMRASEPSWDDAVQKHRLWPRWYARYWCWVYNFCERRSAEDSGAVFRVEERVL